MKRSLFGAATLAGWLALGAVAGLAACAAQPVEQALNLVPTPTPQAIALTADGRTIQLTTSAATVGDLLAEAGILLGPADELSPPPETPLAEADGSVVLVRVTERLESEVEPIPFGRRTVRTSELPPDAPPRLLQKGQPGEREVAIRVVLRDGIEAERWRTTSRVVRPPRDEIVLVGVGASTDAFPIEGTLAAIDDGRAVVWRGSTDNPSQLPVDGTLDGRVFQLSPDGRLLLFTTAESTSGDGTAFGNSLRIVDTGGDLPPVDLGIDNVLWAAWDPGQAESPRLAYTTARAVSLPPGWEANNDLWLLEFEPDASGTPVAGAPIRLIETYPATYGWWGGHFDWAPGGDRLAYAFADEVGTIAMPAPGSLPLSGVLGVDQTVYQPLYRFTPYDTRSDWAWVPALSWAPDGSRLLATVHSSEDSAVADPFNQVWIDSATGETETALEGAGMWAFAHWSAAAERRIASLLATEPEASQDSSYTLWLSGPDGQAAERIYPPQGENSLFPRIEQYLDWSPDGRALAFIFDDALHLMDVRSGEVYRAADDDRRSSHPTWAPYGSGISGTAVNQP
jgi:hypothetical protein